jgi:hypothetical protein
MVVAVHHLVAVVVMSWCCPGGHSSSRCGKSKKGKKKDVPGTRDASALEPLVVVESPKVELSPFIVVMVSIDVVFL